MLSAFETVLSMNQKSSQSFWSVPGDNILVLQLSRPTDSRTSFKMEDFLANVDSKSQTGTLEFTMTGSQPRELPSLSAYPRRVQPDPGVVGSNTGNIEIVRLLGFKTK